ncbi:DUF3427 domain-containing protein [Thermomonas sp.]|uniref:DUF3427 domain-containing protein n=1 Tax=Thermomonas sp. TaxID=1971895 RepID=UPI00260298D9|nr:DUF3427 domain-containing protein [Thermomonas sp.]MCO5055007.1 DUF3427 domain-containing protein [Thermomonas sp.]HRO63104.1 DUF3427 domain-containing protein [Thermomonas sp.]
MPNLRRGLYEQLIDATLQGRIDRIDTALVAAQTTLHPADAADRLALHLGRMLRRLLDDLDDAQRVPQGIALAQRIIALLQEDAKADPGDQLDARGGVLSAVCARHPDGTPESITPPATPLLDTTLLTNAPGEPRIGFQIKSEIASADRIDVLMAFVRQTGIRPLLDNLRRHCASGRPLRLLTTTYTQSTELSALQALRDIGVEIRVSYDTSGTRLHAKAWLFHRQSGYSTAYIGSSNLTHAAQVSGLEWNIRIAGARNPDVIEKFNAVFESYWASDDFRPFDADEFRQLTQAASSGPRIYLSPIELRPEPFQARLLEQITVARTHGHHRNLLVAATGTGKTVMAAIDYQELRTTLPRARLLFVAHRREILEQSLATFRHALRDAAFGELWVGEARPALFEHVFASIQSLTANGLTALAPDHFDVVIIDEFHHAAAPTYAALLGHLQPRELLGLTATPERGDALDILHWFDDRIAAELRLWDAIEQQRLCPFHYYGISDGTDLRHVGWRRGRGYDPAELETLVTGNDVLARLVIKQTLAHVSDAETMRALGFCVSVRHAEFMARAFNAAGLAAVAVSATSSEAERANALRDLQTGTVRIVFAVDLFNEGVDLPAVDTLLLLRPTDSATIFLQQLGRGLRRHAGKTACTVLDFVAQHRREFQFQRRLGALLGGSRKQLIEAVEAGFPFLPSGCQMQLDPVASKTILDNLRQSLPGTWTAKVSALRSLATTFPELTLTRFLDETGLALEDVYANNHSWAELREAAGLQTPRHGPQEAILRRALGRLLHVNDATRILAWRDLARASDAFDASTATPRAQRLFHMLAATLLERASGIDTLTEAAHVLHQHPQVRAELDELLGVLEAQIDHRQPPLAIPCETPLHVHARYSRREILAAFASGNSFALPVWREGVRWLPEAGIDLLAVTLDKSSGHFSPTTRYRDYAISRELIHWESQSTTREDSPTGRRYRALDGAAACAVLLARIDSEQRAFWLLGPAGYVSHQGERPLAITWRLQVPLPGDLYTDFAAAVA